MVGIYKTHLKCMMNVKDIEMLFKMHYRPMHRLAATILHDDESARDIVHDVFESLLHTESKVDISLGYLLTAVRNRCINLIRDNELHSKIEKMQLIDCEEYEDWPDNETPSAHRNIQLSATYTFGYGKKIRRGNEVRAQGNAASAIVKE